MSPRWGSRNVPALRSPVKQSSDQGGCEQLFIEVSNHVWDIATRVTYSGAVPEWRDSLVFASCAETEMR